MEKEVNYKFQKHSFTLLELLVIVAFGGILISILFVGLMEVKIRTRDTERKAVISQIRSAMEMCFLDQNCGGGENQYPTWSTTTKTNVEKSSIGKYLTIPEDPVNDYYAAANGDIQKYCIYIKLEREGWVCASNKGWQSTDDDQEPTIHNCCGMIP